MSSEKEERNNNWIEGLLGIDSLKILRLEEEFFEDRDKVLNWRISKGNVKSFDRTQFQNSDRKSLFSRLYSTVFRFNLDSSAMDVGIDSTFDMPNFGYRISHNTRGFYQMARRESL